MLSLQTGIRVPMKVFVSALLLATCLSAHAGEWKPASAKSQELYPNWVVTSDVDWKFNREADRNFVVGLCLVGAIVAFAVAMARMSKSGGGRRRTRRVV